MSAEFRVRVATLEDTSPVSLLLSASYPVLMEGSYDPTVLNATLPLMTKANPALLSAGTYYVAETAEGGMVGCGGWTRERPGSGEVAPRLAHIRHFATHPEWVGRSIGRQLYETCEQEARAAGVRQFECYASLNAEGFYAAMGFRCVRRLQVPMGPGLTLPSVLMTRAI